MVYILLADGFEEVEALAPCDMLRRAGIGVSLVSVSSKLFVKGAHGITVYADMCLSELKADELEMLVLPGGMPGTKNLDALVQIDVLLDHCIRNEKYIAAICAAPSVLGKRGILNGKKAICYPGFEDSLKGADICHGQRVVADGKIVTAIGEGAAQDFGLKLVELLTDKDTSEKIRSSVY